jgi:hypothetical protein
MKIFLMLVTTASMVNSPVLAQKSAARGDRPDCALESRQAVARRHGLHESESHSLSMKIYADPKLAQEADDAFDACVRRYH